MKKLPLAAFLALVAAPYVHSDTILGVYAGAGIWNADSSGEAGKPSVTLDELGTKQQSNNFYYIALEHPVPLVPNIRLEHTSITSKQSANITKTFTIDGTDFVPGKVNTDFDLSNTDATLYYEILDNWINLDVGVTARKFSGYVYAQSETNNLSTKVKLNETLPLLYGKFQFDLPFSGLSAGVEGNYISYQDSKLSDYTAKISYLYDSVLDVGVEAGYRSMTLKVDKSDIKGDLEFKGPYASLIAHF